MRRSDRSTGPRSALPSPRTFAAAMPAAARQPIVNTLRTVVWSMALACVLVSAAAAQPPSRLAQVPAVPIAEAEMVPPAAAIPPRNTGPQAMAHSRYRRGRHGTTRIIRRTPAVMREDAARVKRGDLFSTWSNEYLE